jgi:hypothetical protein
MAGHVVARNFTRRTDEQGYARRFETSSKRSETGRVDLACIGAVQLRGPHPTPGPTTAQPPRASTNRNLLLPRGYGARYG